MSKNEFFEHSRKVRPLKIINYHIIFVLKMGSVFLLKAAPLSLF